MRAIPCVYNSSPSGRRGRLLSFYLRALPGCGKGFSTMEFRQRGADVLCAEGSHDAVTQSILPPSLVVEHDFTRGPWWPDRTYDALWSVEFFEHVGRPYIPNYLPVLRRSALLFVSSSGFGGWHHVEVHNQNWWRARLQAQGTLATRPPPFSTPLQCIRVMALTCAGFVFSDYYTDLVHKYAKEGRQAQFDSQHIAHGMQASERVLCFRRFVLCHDCVCCCVCCCRCL